jgi:hypothetical protein
MNEKMQFTTPVEVTVSSINAVINSTEIIDMDTMRNEVVAHFSASKEARTRQRLGRVGRVVSEYTPAPIAQSYL